jgi:hypothetical protein
MGLTYILLGGGKCLVIVIYNSGVVTVGRFNTRKDFLEPVGYVLKLFLEVAIFVPKSDRQSIWADRETSSTLESLKKNRHLTYNIAFITKLSTNHVNQKIQE